ncbi:hypothetical protein L2U69_11915 [Zavarzinia compransoris]|uniref:hypothetical protein n=1 Tax=Zavarzinia marina TaxID=2911065 RepID=UPI001F265FA5|nr:hypothetical protein [Zavarzinia marina]MCF4166353.1 hypothetical protein [Zavarzinia marina]
MATHDTAPLKPPPSLVEAKRQARIMSVTGRAERGRRLVTEALHEQLRREVEAGR